MPDDKQRIDNLNQTELARFILDIIHRSILHYGLWFTEVRHQMGSARALGILKTAYERSMDIQMNRLSKVFGFELQDGLPKAMLEMDRGELKKLLDGFCANWLANDGVWFQAVEFKDGMNDAKRCNDSVWAQFSLIEAWSIKRFLDLPERPGLARAKKSPRVPDLRPDQHPVRHRGGPRQPGVPDERVPGAVRPQAQRPRRITPASRRVWWSTPTLRAASTTGFRPSASAARRMRTPRRGIAPGASR